MHCWHSHTHSKLSGVPQVEHLGIDERLLEKWQARRDIGNGGTTGARLLLSVLAAMFGAFARWVYSSDERAAARVRIAVGVLCVVLFAAILLASNLV